MDGLILLLALACSAAPTPTSTADPAPAPVTAPAPAPAAEEPFMIPDLPDEAILQVFRPRDGYVLRIWADGRWTEARAGGPDEPRDPFDPTLRYDEVRARFVEAQRASWGEALAQPVDPGPHVSPSSRRPGGGEIRTDELVFRARSDGRVLEATVRGDLTVPASLGPLEPPWRQLRDRLWAPRR